MAEGIFAQNNVDDFFWRSSVFLCDSCYFVLHNQKRRRLFLQINLSKVSFLSILKIYGKGRDDTIFEETCTSHFYTDGISRWQM